MNDQKLISISVPQSLESVVRELLVSRAQTPEPCQKCLDRNKEREEFPNKFKTEILNFLFDCKYDGLSPLELAKSLHEAGQYLLENTVVLPSQQKDDGPL